MLYIRINFTKTESGSRSDCPILDRHIKRAHWFHLEPEDCTVGYAGLPDDCYEVAKSPDVAVVEKGEAIDFKRRVEAVHDAIRGIKAVAADESASEAKIEEALTAVDDEVEGVVRRLWNGIKGLFGF